ncbi:hypothetical protein JMJ77_0013555, partial [Colletotrichum scovillei]
MDSARKSGWCGFCSSCKIGYLRSTPQTHCCALPSR